MGLEFKKGQNYGFCVSDKVCKKAKDNFEGWEVDTRVIVKVYCLDSDENKLPKDIIVPEDIKKSDEEKASVSEKVSKDDASVVKNTLIRKANLERELKLMSKTLLI